MAFHNDPPVRQIITPADAVTGTTRIVVGADTPAELASYGAAVALLFYVVDVPTNLEVGYFFIALSNTLDTGTENVLFMGQTVYPTPGVPSSATSASVKTNFQVNLNDSGGTGGATKFKDYRVDFNPTVPQVNFNQLVNFFGYIATATTFKNNPDTGQQIVIDQFNNRIQIRAAQPTGNGNSAAAIAAITPRWIVSGTDDTPTLLFQSPGLTSKVRASIELDAQSSGSATDNSFVVLSANSVFTTAPNITQSSSNTGTATFDGTVRVGKGNQEIGQGVREGSTTTASSSTTAAATETVVNTCASTTFFSGRAYGVKVLGGVLAGTAAAVITLRIRKGTTTAGTVVSSYTVPCAVASTTYGAGFDGVFKVVGGTDVTTAMCLTIQASAGTAQHISNVTRGFYIEDIGSSGQNAFAGEFTLT